MSEKYEQYKVYDTLKLNYLHLTVIHFTALLRVTSATAAKLHSLKSHQMIMCYLTFHSFSTMIDVYWILKKKELLINHMSIENNE